MKLFGACIGTHNIELMVKFYEKVFGCGPYIDGPDHRFLDAQLIVFNLDYMDATVDDPPTNIAMVYAVDDVDLEFARLKSLGIADELPTNRPWGVRSFTVNDPDGNVISFFKNL